MNWINIRTDVIRKEEFMEATDEQLGVWVKLLLYCCERENSGLIAGSEKWTDVQWQRSCGLTEASVKAESPLWRFTRGK